MQFEWHICCFLGGQHVAAVLQITRWILTAKCTRFDGTFCLHLQTGHWHHERQEWSEHVCVSLKSKGSVNEVTEPWRNQTEVYCDLFRPWTIISMIFTLHFRWISPPAGPLRRTAQLEEPPVILNNRTARYFSVYYKVRGCSRGKQIIFYLVIYWTQKVHNDFIFLCSLHCALSTTLQKISITVVNLHNNRPVVRICIPILRFSVDSPS